MTCAALKSCMVNTSNQKSDVDLSYGSAEVLTRLKKVFGTTTPKEGRQDFLVVQSPKIWSCGGGLLRRPRVASSISVLLRPQERPSFPPLLLLDNGDMHIDYEVNFKSLFLNACMVQTTQQAAAANSFIQRDEQLVDHPTISFLPPPRKCNDGLRSRRGSLSLRAIRQQQQQLCLFSESPFKYAKTRTRLATSTATISLAVVVWPLLVVW